MADYQAAGAVGMLVDSGRPVLSFLQFVLLAISQPVTISGYFCSLSGFPVSPNGTTWTYSATISNATPQTLLNLFGLTSISAEAVGFVGQLSGAVAFCAASPDGVTVPGANSTDMVANVSRYPQIAATTALRLGRA